MSGVLLLRGRPRLLNPGTREELRQLIADSPSLYLDEIADWILVNHGEFLSITAIHDNIRDLGITRKLLRKPAAERDIGQRIEWLHLIHSNFTAEQLVFADESSKNSRTVLRRYGRALAGERAEEVVSLDRGERYSVLPAISVDGCIAVRAICGSVDGAEFFDWVLNDLVWGPANSYHLFLCPDHVLQLPHMNRYPGPCSVLALDNCRTHKTLALQELLDAAGMPPCPVVHTVSKYFTGCVLLFLPSYSPDLNPIEEAFSCCMFASLILLFTLLALLKPSFS